MMEYDKFGVMVLGWSHQISWHFGDFLNISRPLGGAGLKPYRSSQNMGMLVYYKNSE